VLGLVSIKIASSSPPRPLPEGKSYFFTDLLSIALLTPEKGDHRYTGL
jgi:hypothetical protein